MNVPFHLRRLATSLSPTGLLIPARDTARVLEAVAAMGLPLPEIHAVPEGFLLRRSEPITAHPAGTLRLRERAPHLFVPVDAELAPALLDDEASALVRDRGLIFLPGECVLAYDRFERLTLAELIATAPVRRGAWRTLPPGSRLAERIRAILDERPRPEVEEILQAAAGEVAQEAPPRPPEAPTTAAAVTGSVQSGVGRFLHWLGNLVNWRWLAQQGANLLNRGMQNNPRTAEQVHGEQQAALRELLRQFREGDREAALRRALPIGGPEGRGGNVTGGTQLPTHNLRFSLGDLLRTGQGPAGVWITPEDVAAQLTEEYRRSAREAANAGDFRRAAFIYGKLLGDFRLAADMLARGGLHAEAATLYLDRVGDESAAARCFANAGDIDRAVQLYRKLGRYVDSGNVLRDAGEDDAALTDYLRAADELLRQDRAPEAGDLLVDHVRRPDLAIAYYQVAWHARPAVGATPAVLRLLDIHALRQDRAALWALASEAADFYEADGSESEAVRVYNSLVRLGEQNLSVEDREALRDRALRGLAQRLRRHAAIDQRPGGTVSTLLGRDGVWPAGVVADAEVALRGELRERPARPAVAACPMVSLGHAGVTAVAGSTNGEVLYIGFEDGHVLRFRPATASVQTIDREKYTDAIDSLATDPLGLRLLVLSGSALESYGPQWNGRLSLQGKHSSRLHDELIFRLSPLISHRGDWLTLLWNPEVAEAIAVDGLNVLSSQRSPLDHNTTEAQLVPWPEAPLRVRFSFEQVQGVVLDAGASEPAWIDFGGMVMAPGERVDPLPIRVHPEENGSRLIVVAGTRGRGQPWLAHLQWSQGQLVVVSCRHSTFQGVKAVSILDPNHLVVAQRDGVTWLQRTETALEATATTPAALDDAVAIWPCWQGREVIVVRGRGDLVRVTRPR